MLQIQTKHPHRASLLGKVLKPAAALLAVGLLAGPTFGATFNTRVYHNDYSSVADGANPPGWSTTDDSWHVVGSTQNYRWTDSITPNTTEPTSYTGNLDNGNPASGMTNYRVVAPMKFSSGVYAGILARYTDPNNFYIVRRGAGSNDLELVKRDGGNFDKLDATANDTIGVEGVMEVIVNGNSITGNWYNSLGDMTPVATVSATDNSHSSGTFGFFGKKPNSTGGAFYSKSISVYTAVPEPASLGLLAVGAGLVLFRRRSHAA